ncbi:MAG: XRE family transcriptional regulator [Methylocystis sp.]|uniref:XRE family transcriptional regulator n=1 Tax=Methylocystis sp. TaxID=1911079 RepID=UPI003DA263E7
MTTIGERLRFRRKQLGISQAEVARRVRRLRPGVTFSQQAYQQLEKGDSRSSVELPAVCEALGVSLQWVRDAVGFPPIPPEDARVGSGVDQELGHERVNAILEADVRSGAGGGGVPIDHYVHDQAGNTYAAEGIAGEWSLPQPVMSGMLRASPQNIRVFEVIGDSMEPRLKSGDRVFVDRRLTYPNPEGIFVLWDGYSIVVKQLQIVRGTDPLKLRVISANPHYEPYEVLADEVNIIGRFVGRFTTE